MRLARRGENIDIAVQDQGSGIPAEHLDLIWERFYRVDDSRDRGTGGMGLGLAIVKRILDLHGSRITVSSQLNSGTEFQFELPVYQKAA